MDGSSGTPAQTHFLLVEPYEVRESGFVRIGYGHMDFRYTYSWTSQEDSHKAGEIIANWQPQIVHLF